MYDKDGRQLPASGLHADFPKEVFELKKMFPSVDFEGLVTALAVSDNNVDIAKTVSICCNKMLQLHACCRPEVVRTLHLMSASATITCTVPFGLVSCLGE